MNEHNWARQLPHVLSILFHFQMLLHKDLNKITLYFITTSLTNYISEKNEAKYISLKE